MNNLSIPNKILHWYDNNKRDLPWRKAKSQKQSEYFTLVSEVMLQQTQVNTVVPYFNRFIKISLQCVFLTLLRKTPFYQLLRLK